MSFELKWAPAATKAFADLEARARAAKALELLSQNPRHPGLETHEYSSLEHPFASGEKVFEAYAQNRTPGAYRIFWCYGPGRGAITIIAITPHP